MGSGFGHRSLRKVSYIEVFVLRHQTPRRVAPISQSLKPEPCFREETADAAAGRGQSASPSQAWGFCGFRLAAA